MDIFMSVPGVTGESVEVGQVNRIILESCEVGFGRASDPSTGLPAGAIQQRELFIVKRLDTSTTFFGNASGRGLLLPDGSFIVFRKPFSVSALEVCQMTITGGRVEHQSISLARGGGPPREAIRISFTKLTVKTYLRNASTGALISTSSYTFQQL